MHLKNDRDPTKPIIALIYTLWEDEKYWSCFWIGDVDKQDRVSFTNARKSSNYTSLIADKQDSMQHGFYARSKSFTLTLPGFTHQRWSRQQARMSTWWEKSSTSVMSFTCGITSVAGHWSGERVRSSTFASSGITRTTRTCLRSKTGPAAFLQVINPATSS